MNEAVPPGDGTPGIPRAVPGTEPTGAVLVAAVENARRLYENVTAWYNAADTKAQIILTVDGAFIAVLGSTIFAEPSGVRELTAAFPPETWMLLLLMSLSLTGSIASALACLWSRLYRKKAVDEIFRTLGVDVRRAASYPPDVLWFFQFVRRLDRAQFQARLLQMDGRAEVTALGFQVSALSDRVTRKHRWVNAGFVLTGCSFVFFLAAGMFYLASV